MEDISLKYINIHFKATVYSKFELVLILHFCMFDFILLCFILFYFKLRIFFFKSEIRRNILGVEEIKRGFLFFLILFF